MTTCPLCKGPENVAVRSAYDRDVSRVKCVRCGTFEIEGSAWALYPPEVASPLDANRYLLSGRARNATLENRVEKFNLNDFGAAERGELREPDLDEKMHLILAWFQRRSTRFGEILLQVSETDYPVGYCRDPHEWMAVIRAMVDEKKWLATDHAGFGVTLAGREKLREQLAVEVAERGDYWSTYPDADLDALTKLLLRGRFNIDLERSFAEASETSPVALLFVDIDHFKKINDEHGGHAEGDRVLGGVSEILRNAVGRRGLVYRYGGEEITVILPGFSRSEAAVVAERLRASVERVDWQARPTSIGDGQHWRRERARRQDHQSGALLPTCRPGDVFSQD